MSQIEVKNLSVSYDKLSILDGVNLSAQKGEFIAIVGKSGSGKTTLLQAIARLISYSGLISTPKTIGVVFQNYAVFPWLTVSENIMFGLEKHDRKSRDDIVKENIRLAGLDNKKYKYPAELSGGQIQRVALARSLAHNPEVLLMDEPYGALDAYTRDQMQKWLLDVWTKHKKTVIFVTHNIEEAIFLADRVLVLSKGKFVKEFKISFDRPRKDEIKFDSTFNILRKNIFESVREEID